MCEGDLKGLQKSYISEGEGRRKGLKILVYSILFALLV